MALWRRQAEIFRSGRGGNGGGGRGGKRGRALSVPRKPAADRMGMHRTQRAHRAVCHAEFAAQSCFILLQMVHLQRGFAAHLG